MDIGPDGSLCRITSSAKNYPNNIMILKIPDDEQQSSNLTYKLVSIFPDNHESSSDKSDDDDYIDDKFEIKLREMSKNKDNKALGEKKSISKTNNSKRVQYHKEQEVRTNADWRKDRRISYDRVNPGIKPFRFSSINSSYIQQSTPPPAKDINPWLVDPQFAHAPFLIQNFQPFNNVEAVLNTSSNCDISSKSVGLLGDSPFSQVPRQFHQTLNSFPNLTYWGEEYNSSDYPRPLLDRQSPLIQQGYINGYQQNQRNKTWPMKSNKNVGEWKRNEVAPRRDRMQSNTYYNYHR